MVKFCPNCGNKISENKNYCTECGADTNFSIAYPQKETSAITNPEIDAGKDNAEKKTGIWDILFYGVVIVTIIFFLLIIVGLFTGQSGSSHSSQSQVQSSSNIFVPTESLTERNIRIANQIVADYHSTHTYSLNDFYVCGDMASDVWDMLKTQGINAKLNVGRVDQDITSIKDANHVWVLAEVAPNQYLALEATGGYSVEKADNPRYYTGWSFYNPKQLKNYQQLVKQYNDALSKYKIALNDYNNYIAEYNNAGFFSKIGMKSVLDDKKLILNQRIKDLNDIDQQIASILNSL
jgi:hypothetical protein